MSLDARQDYDRELLRWQLTEEAKHRHRNELAATAMEYERMAANTGMFVLRSLVTVNGAAAIALLALLGALNHEFRPHQALINAIAPALSEFGYGVVCAFLASAVGYFWVSCEAGRWQRYRLAFDVEEEEARKLNCSSELFSRGSQILKLLCVLLCIASFVYFMRGLYIASISLGSG